MKRFFSLILCFLLLFFSCSAPSDPPVFVHTDALGRTVSLSRCPTRVIALSGSLGEVWCLAGGTLLAATEDAVSEGRITEDVAIIGTVKEPNLERILSLSPDFVILSADIPAHVALAETFGKMGIPCGLYRVKLFDDYLSLLGDYCAITARPDLLSQNGVEVQARIAKILASSPDMSGKKVLLLRAYSSGCRAKDSNTLAGTILRDFGFENVMDGQKLPMEELSVEEVIRLDPYAIFVTTMGSDTDAALSYFEGQLLSDPAWQSLTAAKARRFYLLPKELFHYKPNARWAEAYEYVAGLTE